MSELLEHCPRPSEWGLDWERLVRALPFVAEFKGCPQDPSLHGEGDLLTHTRMTVELMCESPIWRESAEPERQAMFLAALLHDIGKPGCTRLEAGRITARGHARSGARIARKLMRTANIPPLMRETVCALIQHHMEPAKLIKHEDAHHKLIRISQLVRCDMLALLAEVNTRARICSDIENRMVGIGGYIELCQNLDCLDRPFAFASSHSRFCYFRDIQSSARASISDKPRLEVILVCGIKQAERSAFITRSWPDLPVISPADYDVTNTGDPLTTADLAISAARDHARALLSRGQPFVFETEGLLRPERQELVGLFAGYLARVSIVYVEKSGANHGSDDDALPRRWAPPDRTEAHEVHWVFDDHQPIQPPA